MFSNPFERPGEYGEPNRPDSGEVGGIPEAQKVLQGLLAELPDEARDLVERIDREAAKVQEQAEEEVARIREEAESKVAAVQSRAENRRKALLQHAAEQLEPLQKESFRAGELGKALAVFVQVQALKARAMNVLPDPGDLRNYEEVGRSYCFRVTGSTHGPVWGAGTYTSDSHLATAAVHAGALEAGEEGVVRVSLVDMSRIRVQGSLSHGVMSMDWGPYPVGYRVARA
jgi:hypothetical protein